jgi:tetratricopeptide (TPR) repeat protein
MVSDTHLSSWSLNELAASLSTIEARHGSIRKSKKLLSQALLEPNENTVAQAIWLAPTLGQEVTKPQMKIIAPFEADARLNFEKGEYTQALKCANDWFSYQPFTSRPAVLASYIASVCLQDDHQAIDILEKAKATSPDSFLLQNNYAFALASLNRVVEADSLLAEIEETKLNDREKNILLATKGLVAFRKGRDDEGRNLYKAAMSGFKKLKAFRSIAIAASFLAREETIIHSRFEKEAVQEATDLAQKYEVKEIVEYAKRLASMR